jgi:hypothetical protein
LAAPPSHRWGSYDKSTSRSPPKLNDLYLTFILIANIPLIGLEVFYTGAIIPAILIISLFGEAALDQKLLDPTLFWACTYIRIEWAVNVTSENLRFIPTFRVGDRLPATKIWVTIDNTQCTITTATPSFVWLPLIVSCALSILIS